VRFVFENESALRSGIFGAVFEQGCQMDYLHTRNFNFGILNGKCLLCLWPLPTYIGILKAI
jgi:hypothetical protein